MSRSGYCDEIEDYWQWIRWRGAVTSALRGRRGQAFLRELIAALDAMPKKELVEDALLTAQGEVCALGSVMVARGMDTKDIDPEDTERVAGELGLAETMVREIVYANDEECWHKCRAAENPAARRWQFMRDWAENRLLEMA